MGSTTHTLRPKSYHTSSSVPQTYIHSIWISTPNIFRLSSSKLKRSLTVSQCVRHQKYTQTGSIPYISLSWRFRYFFNPVMLWSNSLKLYSYRQGMFPLWRWEKPSGLWTTECIWVCALQSNGHTQSVTKSAHPRTCSHTCTPWSKGREDNGAMWTVSLPSATLSIFPQEKQGREPVRGHYIGIHIHLLTPSYSSSSMVYKQLLVVIWMFLSTVSVCLRVVYHVLCRVCPTFYFI